MRLAALAMLAAAALGACSATVGSRADERTTTLTVFAAASLRPVFDDLERRWSEAAPDVDLVASFDGSNVLATQIVEGAPAQVLLSADPRQAQRLLDAGLASGPPERFAGNRLLIATPAASIALEHASDLARPGLALVAAGEDVPISRYARVALEALAATTDDPAGFLARIDANVVSREDNVRAALAKVELGEGDAAIVYRTDALASDAVSAIEFPEPIDVEADYVAVAVGGEPAARTFIEWLSSDAAREVLAAAGFLVDGR